MPINIDSNVNKPGNQPNLFNWLFRVMSCEHFDTMGTDKHTMCMHVHMYPDNSNFSHTDLKIYISNYVPLRDNLVMMSLQMVGLTSLLIVGLLLLLMAGLISFRMVGPLLLLMAGLRMVGLMLLLKVRLI